LFAALAHTGVIAYYFRERATMGIKTTRELLSGYAGDVQQAMQDWQVPGCAIGIVKDGKTIFAKGLGRRDVQNKLPVTPDTVFAIGSCTKAFTCVALGMLADEGKLDWDKPVREYMPDFRVFDPVATERMTARDLVTHRSGLPRHDSMWYGSPLSRSELFARLRHLEPSKDFRAVFQYNNLMYMAAGMLLERVAGTTWEDFMQARLLTPLGMARSNVSVSALQALDDVAKPYHKRKDDVIEVPHRNIDAIGPAGAINSSINDMLRWVKLNLNRGRHGDAHLIADATLKDIHAPHMAIMEAGIENPEIGQATYGLGWIVSSYRGHDMLQHGGGIDGFTSLVTLLLRDGIGIVVLTNQDESPVPTIATFDALDRLLKLKPARWNKRYLKLRAQRKQAEAQQKKEEKPIEAPVPIRLLEDYAGDFAHAGYGCMNITASEERLHLHYNGFDVPLSIVKGDAFAGKLEMHDLHLRLAFSSDFGGNINTFVLLLEPDTKPITFVRVPASINMDKAVLEKFAGQYDLSGMIATIALQGEEGLVAILTGQPRYSLIPVEAARFNLKDMPGYSVSFTLDDAGVAQTITFHQPEGNFTGKRV
jgi:CubicO group peptidase (beta-lactamase class C family)